MDRISPFPAAAHNQFAAPLLDQQLGDSRLGVLALLVLVGLALLLALRATLIGIGVLLRTTVALARTAFSLGKWLLVVVGLVVAVGAGMVGGSDDASGQPAPTRSSTPQPPEPLTHLRPAHPVHPAHPTR